MNNLTEIDDLTKRTRRYEFLDGLVDITYGVLFLALGLLTWFITSTFGLKWYATALIRNREITILGMVLVFSSLVLLIFGSQRIIQRIRLSTDWKSKGFVKPLRLQVRWPVQLIAAVVSITIILLAFGLMLKGYLTQDDALRFLVFSVGVSTGITFVGLGIDLKITRYLCVGICGIVASTMIILLRLSFSMSWLFFGISWVVFLAASGGWAFYKYRTTSKRSTNE
jgi:hypothetical protein